MNLATQIKNLISNDQLSEALNLLLDNIDSDEVYLQSAEYANLRKEMRAGVLSNEVLRSRRNKIVKSLLEIADDIENNFIQVNKKNDLLKSLYYFTTKLSHKRKRKFFLLSVIGIFALLNRAKILSVFIGLTLIAFGISFYYNYSNFGNLNNFQIGNGQQINISCNQAKLSNLFLFTEKRINRLGSKIPVSELPESNIQGGFVSDYRKENNTSEDVVIKYYDLRRLFIDNTFDPVIKKLTNKEISDYRIVLEGINNELDFYE